MARLNLSPGVSCFEDLINGNFLYVDKTEYLWKLIESGDEACFLSCPRRFGRSLTISTLEAIFQGKKELFKGLAIYDKQYDWKKYPIIKLSNVCCAAQSAQELEHHLNALLKNIAIANGLELRGSSIYTNFRFLIEDMSREAPVVILVDEYDKPILNNITRPVKKELLNVLINFYSTIKSCQSNIRFAFVTGVTRICLATEFGGLNNLYDISMDEDYATMLGYTQSEFEKNFEEWISYAEEKQELSRDELLARIKLWYGGFRFAGDAECVYNPVSLVNFFNTGCKFHNYWFSTGTPSSLVNLIKYDNLDIEEVTRTPPMVSWGDTIDIENVDATVFLRQTGYLTIKSTKKIFDRTFYHLDFPNFEVRKSFDVLTTFAKKRKIMPENHGSAGLMTCDDSKDMS